jgi:hypothetical protein
MCLPVFYYDMRHLLWGNWGSHVLSTDLNILRVNFNFANYRSFFTNVNTDGKKGPASRWVKNPVVTMVSFHDNILKWRVGFFHYFPPLY